MEENMTMASQEQDTQLPTEVMEELTAETIDQELQLQQEEQIPASMPVLPGTPEPEEEPEMKKVVKTVKPLRKRIHLALRGLLQVLSLLLSLALAVSLVAFAVVSDLRTVTSGQSIEKMVSSAFEMIQSLDPEEPKPLQAPKRVGLPASRMARYDAADHIPEGGIQMPSAEQIAQIPFIYNEDGTISGVTTPDGTVVELPENVFFEDAVENAILVSFNSVTGKPIFVVPVFNEEGNIIGLMTDDGNTQDVEIEVPKLPEGGEGGGSTEGPALDISDPESIVEWAYVKAQELVGDRGQVSKEAIRNFVRKSNVTKFLANKVGQYANDILVTGKLETQITTQEIVTLLQENKDLIKEEFKVELDDQQLEALTQTVQQVVEEEKINDKIHQSVNTVLESEEPVVLGMTIQQALDILRSILANKVMMTLLAVCIVLLVLLCLANFYNLPAGLTWAAIPCITVGLALSVPVMLADMLPSLLGSLSGDLASFGGMMVTVVRLLAPVHYGVLAVGIGLLVASIAWRIVRMVVRKKKVVVYA